MSETKRYSDKELELFKIHIEQKLEKANNDLEFLQDQISDLSDSKGNDGDWLDDTSNNNDLEMLYTMANRQRHYIRDLGNALIRIHNKSYGICVLTGELIDKRRLMAVPTTTKSLAAKNAAMLQGEKKVLRSDPVKKKSQGKVFSKLIRKNNTSTKPANLQESNDIIDENILNDKAYNGLGMDLDYFSD